MSKGILGWNQQDVLTQFQNGKAAMMVNGPWQIPVLRDQSPDLKWEVSTLPKDKQGASILGGENYSIIKGGPNIDAAWDLLVWTQQPENLKPYLSEAGKLPSRQDLAEDPYWTGDPVLAVFIEQLKVAKPRAYGSHYPGDLQRDPGRHPGGGQRPGAGGGCAQPGPDDDHPALAVS